MAPLITGRVQTFVCALPDFVDISRPAAEIAVSRPRHGPRALRPLEMRWSVPGTLVLLQAIITRSSQAGAKNITRPYHFRPNSRLRTGPPKKRKAPAMWRSARPDHFGSIGPRLATMIVGCPATYAPDRRGRDAAVGRLLVGQASAFPHQWTILDSLGLSASRAMLASDHHKIIISRAEKHHKPRPKAS